MNEEEKKAYMLLKSIIFHYHGLDEEEEINLQETADKLNAHNALAWANEFIAQDYVTSFERAREYLNDIISDYSRVKRSEYIQMVYDSNNLKGFITELELNAMIQLAADWSVQEELETIVKSNLYSND